MVALLGAAADVAVGAWIDGQVERAVAAHTSGAAGVEADVASFGWLPRFLLTGRISESSVMLEEVRGGEIEFTDVQLQLRRTLVDRSRLVGDRVVDVVSVASATITFSLRAEELSRLTGLDVAIDDGVTVAAEGRAIEAEVVVSGGALVLEAELLPSVRVPMPTLPLVPCRPDVVPGAGVLVFSCSLAPVPAALLDVLSR